MRRLFALRSRIAVVFVLGDPMLLLPQLNVVLPLLVHEGLGRRIRHHDVLLLVHEGLEAHWDLVFGLESDLLGFLHLGVLLLLSSAHFGVVHLILLELGGHELGLLGL